MKIRGTGFVWLCAVGAGVFWLSPEAQAADGDWRAKYDLIMMWVNFFILAGVLIKYLRRPIKDFLQNRKAEVEQEIRRIERQKNKAAEQAREARAQLEDSRLRVEQIRERILAQGEQTRERIIEEARNQSRVMLEEAGRRIDTQILHARNLVRAELIDSAIDIAMQTLPGEISEDDNRNFVSFYLETTGR